MSAVNPSISNTDKPVKRFSYPIGIRFGKLLALIFALLNSLLFLLVIGSMAIGSTQITMRSLLAISVLLLGFIIGMYFYDRYAEIDLGKNGIWVNFVFRRQYLRWQDLSSISQTTTPILKSKTWFIHSPQLNQFYILYGLVNLGRPSKCFMIHDRLLSHEVILSEVKQHLLK